MSQGKERHNRRDSAAGWAWSVSIVVHAAVLGVFGIVKFSQWHESERPRVTPVAKVGQIKKIIESEPVIPKPKVKKIITAGSGGAASRPLPARQVFEVQTILRSGRMFPVLLKIRPR
jgi:hypothetical protein